MAIRPDQADHRAFAPLGAERRHYWMVMRMADASDIDLVAAVRAGALTQADWAAMVLRCRSCACVESCQRWLDDPTAGGAQRTVPEGCLNRAHLAALKTQEAKP